jgi:predicted NUDIX family NTP pyrophosphohydrolase
MTSKSAGILLFRTSGSEPEVLLVHPGGPFFVRKDFGYWTVPKGGYTAEEEPLTATIRELYEETGLQLPVDTVFYVLGTIIQKGGKSVQVWAVKGSLDTEKFKSNFFNLEWPPKSGKMRTFPEVDKAVWFPLHKAKLYINARQSALIDRLTEILKEEGRLSPQGR